TNPGVTNRFVASIITVFPLGEKLENNSFVVPTKTIELPDIATAPS
ncbi:unnamed protein product, partial [marine sediment metagenome]